MEPFTFVNSAPTGALPGFVAYSPDGRFAAVTNFFDGTVSIYSVDCETGALTNIQTVPSTPRPLNVNYSPCGQNAVVANTDNEGNTQGSVTVYNVDCETGFWRLLQTLDNTAEINIRFSAVYSPDGRFVAVANQIGGFISMYRVSPLAGTLLFAGTTTTPSLAPNIVAFSPDGKFLAVTEPSSATIFSVNPVTGNLTLVQTIFGIGGGQGITYQHNGKFAAIANVTPASVIVYSVDQITGMFSLAQTVTALDGIDNDPRNISFAVDDGLAVVGVNSDPGTVAIFQVCNGVWQTPAIQTIPGLVFPSGVAISCREFAAIAAGSTVSAYEVHEPACN